MQQPTFLHNNEISIDVATFEQFLLMRFWYFTYSKVLTHMFGRMEEVEGGGEGRGEEHIYKRVTH